MEAELQHPGLIVLDIKGCQSDPLWLNPVFSVGLTTPRVFLVCLNPS